MKLRSMEFELGAVKPAQWPADGLPEFAFVGRSNVGKSSLLNRLLGRKSFARVSATPGKTQQINFYRINDDIRFADLPGYGYASASKTQRAEFAQIIDTYLRERRSTLRIFQLVDVRHDPSADDVAVHEWLLALGRAVSVVATKADKLSRSRVDASVRTIASQLHYGGPIWPVSSTKNAGTERIWSQIEVDLGRRAPEPPTPAKPPLRQVRIGEDHAH